MRFGSRTEFGLTLFYVNYILISLLNSLAKLGVKILGDNLRAKN